MKVYLVRHGETDWNKARKLQGQTDIPLNDYGVELAEITAKALKDVKFDYVFSSPLIRAIQTANIIKNNDALENKLDDRLKEIHFGIFEGDHIPTFEETRINPIWNFEFDTENYIPAEGGESFEDMYARTGAFVEEALLPLEEEYNNVLIVGHGCMNRCIINRYLGTALKDFWDVKLDNCAVSVLDISNGRITVEEPGKKYYERPDSNPDTDTVLSIYG